MVCQTIDAILFNIKILDRYLQSNKSGLHMRLRTCAPPVGVGPDFGLVDRK